MNPIPHGTPEPARAEVRFVPAAEADFEELLTLIAQFHTLLELPTCEVSRRQVLHRLMTTPETGAVWLALQEGSPIPAGYAVVTFMLSLEYGGLAALLDEFYLRPESRGRGIGTRFLEHLECELRARGFHVLRLEVDTHHGEAATLYARHGFRRQPRELWSRPLA